MVYRVGDMILQKTQEVFRGKVNDVIVCRDISDGDQLYYTVIIVHDREIAKQLMQFFHTNDSCGRNKFKTDFTWKESYVMVFEYVEERALDRFFSTEIFSMSECEQMGLKLITECLACEMPYPVLYLQLKQRQIHISKEKSLYLGLCIDLTELSEKITEKDCVTLCARIVLDYMEVIKSGDSISCKLLEKKLWKGGYQQFTDLYKDLRMASQPVKREGILEKSVKVLKQNRDKIFRVLMIVCMIVGIVAFTMIVSQMIFSDIPFLKLFMNPFKQIGTESLLQ